MIRRGTEVVGGGSGGRRTVVVESDNSLRVVAELEKGPRGWLVFLGGYWGGPPKAFPGPISALRYAVSRGGLWD